MDEDLLGDIYGVDLVQQPTKIDETGTSSWWQSDYAMKIGGSLIGLGLIYMGWKKWPYWSKGGIIGLVIGMVLFIVDFGCAWNGGSICFIFSFNVYRGVCRINYGWIESVPISNTF